MKTKSAPKQKGLTDKQLVEKYEAGKIDLVKTLKKGVHINKDKSVFTKPHTISKN